MRHHNATVDDSVQVGENVNIFQFATVIRGAVLEDNVTVAPTAVLDGAYISQGTVVSPGVFIGPGFLVGEEVFLGPHVVLCNDAWPRVDKEGFSYETLKARLTVIVGDGASIGAHAVVLPGVVVGRDAMVAAGAVVDRDIPDFHLFTRSGEIKRIEGEGRALARRMRLLENCDLAVESKPKHAAFFQQLRRKMGRKALSWLQKKHLPTV